jgi:hypothetical protein
MFMRHHFAVAFALTAALLAFGAPARADLLIHVDKSTQQMDVSLDGAPLFVWPVSTGAAGYDTPSGSFKPFRMEKEHFSKEWDDAPMPHSIFFTMKGHAIHGSNHNSIGRPASHGCVRLSPKNAAILFDLVKQEGMAKTRVVLDGEIPRATRMPQVARRVYPNTNDYQTGTYYGQNGVVTNSIPQRRRVVRGWREEQDGQRVYYYRERYPSYGYQVAPAPAPFPFFGR